MVDAADGGGPSVERGVARVPGVVHRRLVTIDGEGNPVVATVPVLPKKAIQDMSAAALSLPFDDPLGIFPEFEGLTMGEVAHIRRARRAAAGNGAALDKLLDRTLGKPKQSTEVRRVEITYEDFVKELARTEAAQTKAEPQLPPGIIDTVIESVDPFAGLGQ